MREGRRIHVVDDPDPRMRRVRTVVEGTDVMISGAGATRAELIEVAASLRPVAP